MKRISVQGKVCLRIFCDTVWWWNLWVFLNHKNPDLELMSHLLLRVSPPSESIESSVWFMRDQIDPSSIGWMKWRDFCGSYMSSDPWIAVKRLCCLVWFRSPSIAVYTVVMDSLRIKKLITVIKLLTGDRCLVWWVKSLLVCPAIGIQNELSVTPANSMWTEKLYLQ